MHRERSFTLFRVGRFAVAVAGEDVASVGDDGPFDASLADVLDGGWEGISRVLQVKTSNGERGFRVPASLQLVTGLLLQVPAYLTPAARRGRWSGLVQLSLSAGAEYALVIDVEGIFAARAALPTPGGAP